MAKITLHGNESQTCGELPQVGTVAPDFNLVNQDLEDIHLEAFGQVRKIIYIVPSLDTPVCAISTKKFNDFAAQHEDVKIIIVSSDLPFAIKRFCAAEKTSKITPLSTMRSKDFLEQYGVRIVDGPMSGLTARALLVLDENNSVIHSELVHELGDEPDYQAALNAAVSREEAGD